MVFIVFIHKVLGFILINQLMYSFCGFNLLADDALIKFFWLE